MIRSEGSFPSAAMLALILSGCGIVFGIGHRIYLWWKRKKDLEKGTSGEDSSGEEALELGAVDNPEDGYESFDDDSD